MIRVLLKKQFMEIFSWLYRNKKKNKNRTKLGIVLTSIVYMFLLVCVGGLFYGIAYQLSPLIRFGYGWLYFAIMGLVAIGLGVFGSAFNSYESLYKSKDNDLLLSMPIPMPAILTARLFGVLMIGLIYLVTALVPTLIIWFSNISISLSAIICTAVAVLMILLLVLVLSAFVGWVVALVAGKVKRKNIVTVFISLGLCAMYFLVGNLDESLQAVTLNPLGTAQIIKSSLFPLYHMGLAAEGNVISTLIFSAIVCALFSLEYFVMSRSFISLTTVNRGTVKKTYKESRAKARSPRHALLIKEALKFSGSSTYMLNCGLGVVFLPVAAVFFIWQKESILSVVESLMSIFGSEVAGLAAALVICFLISTIDISAPSVSLEGKSIWIIQSLPVNASEVLMAKLYFHLYVALPPTAFLLIVVEALLRPSFAMGALIALIAFAFLLLSASVGLFVNLKFPNLTWTNEAVPIKQSMSVGVAMLGGWGLAAALGVIYYFLSSYISPLLYALIVAVLFLSLSLILTRYIRTKGARIFEIL